MLCRLLFIEGSNLSLSVPSPNSPTAPFPRGSKSTSSLPSPSDLSRKSLVNQPLTDQIPILVLEEAARSSHVVPYSYHPNEVIGGDSVSTIERQLLAASPTPTYFELSKARMEAKDLFEVKVKIFKVMSGFHPEGDWMGRGAQPSTIPAPPQERNPWRN
ncbi:conserved hypothetical protein [Ricinus communis]|uniref:DUF8018 domain-containing protein n=1 Tax=Ricinus communis TaxID=3988 RepID=B9S308_RICCO|nr:conserved hypothetical protein [Ricinus communis]